MDPETYREWEFQQFLTDSVGRLGQILPARRIDRCETWESYRLLGIKIGKVGHDYVEAAWPETWRKVRAGENMWSFELRDADGVPMVTGDVDHASHGQQSIYMQLTDTARTLVRRRYAALPGWQRRLIAVKGGPWKTPRMSGGRPFDDYERPLLSVIASRLRALGWEIGEQLPAGVEVLLSDQATGWQEERTAGDRFWLLRSPSSLSYGVAAGDEYPWSRWDLTTQWGDRPGRPPAPTAMATELDQVLRSGVPAGVTTPPQLF
jgi:hypothetical protein